ncbi:ParM/StbA family protein [Clostridium cadaveris]|uniref:ParM/StbA family protein n=1 Tax=Clostridium cadaveris TaxID=1529 RepID=UPI0015B46941|nr:ParM/StbA family protein [Clostridium cadaveris]NWK10391.1 ParM/StbA family protein [Clostridium cadaveris]
MIIGIDVGSSMTKSSEGILIESKVSKVESLNSNDFITIDGVKYYLEEGEYDSNYRKVEKNNYIQLLYAAIALSTDEICNQIGIGLPISQFKSDKEKLKDLILNGRDKKIIINGIQKHIIIDDVEVFPEGVLTVDDYYEGIVVDIGGRTTDICAIEFKNGKRKILNPLSYSKGIQNLYSEFIKCINNKEGLDLTDMDAERILNRGLKIYGEYIDISFATKVFREFVDNLVSKLQIEYPLKTYDVSLVGGGSELLFKSIKKRIPNSILVEDSVFANAYAYKDFGRGIWE